MLEAIVGVAVYAVAASIVLGAVLAICVLAATRLLALTAATRHLLWTIALFTTGVMPLIGIATSLFHVTTVAGPMSAAEPRFIARPHHHAAVIDVPARSVPASAAVASPATTSVPPPTLGERIGTLREAIASATPALSRNVALALVAIWLIGALVGLGTLAGSIVRVRGLKRRSSPLDSPLADELPWLTEVGPGREIYLRLSYEIETPVAIGFRRPVILIPTELATHDGLAAIEQLVLHEHAHLRRYDDWTNLVQRTIERLFWFNPIVWLLGRRIALEREIASDDAVVEKTGAAHQYATSLWKLAREMRMPEHAVVAPGALLTRKQISVRIEQLLDKNRSRLHRSPAAALGVALAAGGAVALVMSAAPAVELPPSAPAIAASTAPIVAHTTALVTASRAPHIAHRTTASVRYVLIEPSTSPAAATRPLPVPIPPVQPAMPAHWTHGVGSSVATSVATTVASAVSTAVSPELAQDITKRVGAALEDLPRQIADSDDEDDSGSHQHLDGVRLSRSLLGSCVGCSMRGADLHGLDLHGLTINGDDLRGANLSGANLSGAHLIGTDLRDANFTGANLRGTTFNGDELRGATLDNAQLDDVHFVGITLSGVSLHGTLLRSVVNNCVGCDLHGLDLRGQDLHGVALNGADLRGVNLSGANLNGARLTGVDLSHADLRGADLTNAHLSGCELTGANLRNANTTGLVLEGTELGD